MEHLEHTGLRQSSQITFDGPSRPNAEPHNLRKGKMELQIRNPELASSFGTNGYIVELIVNLNRNSISKKFD